MTMKLKDIFTLSVVALGCLSFVIDTHGCEPPSAAKPGRSSRKKQDKPATSESNPSNSTQTAKLVPLNKQKSVLLDVPGKRVLLKAKVVLREGILEMLCCLKLTKDYESILAVDAKAYVVHTALLALGAKPGKPVQYFPKYQPATGQRVDVFLQWRDKTGKLHRIPAQNWVRHSIYRYYVAKMKDLPKGLKIPQESELRFDNRNHELTWFGPMTEKQRDNLLALHPDKEYRKAINGFYDQGRPRQMEAHWVFAGSGFDVDETTREKFYRAEVGDLICVANFPSAMLDLSVESSSGNDGRLYEAYTQRIPPLDTEVTIELIPVLKPKSKQAEKQRK